MRLKERGRNSREWIVPGFFEQATSAPSDGDSTSLLHDVVKCRSPVIEGDTFPVDVRIAVALNGLDFVSLHGSTFVIATRTGLPTSNLVSASRLHRGQRDASCRETPGNVIF